MGGCQGKPWNYGCECRVAQIIARETKLEAAAVGRRPWAGTSLFKHRWLTDGDKEVLASCASPELAAIESAAQKRSSGEGTEVVTFGGDAARTLDTVEAAEVLRFIEETELAAIEKAAEMRASGESADVVTFGGDAARTLDEVEAAAALQEIEEAESASLLEKIKEVFPLNLSKKKDSA